MDAIASALLRQAREDRVAALRQLVDHMHGLTSAGADIFMMPPAAGRFDRVYGGQSLAEAFMAAAATVDADRSLNSVHCNFLRLGDPSHAVTYRVDRLNDTRTFSVRQVKAEQGGRVVLAATFSFAAATQGVAHQISMPDAPRPETVIPRDIALMAHYGDRLPKNAGVPWAIDMRHVDLPPWSAETGDGCNRVWMRADENLPDDPLLHSCILLYASDLCMADAVTTQHPIPWDDMIEGRGIFGASLEHNVWLHGPVRMDRWLLHIQESTVAAGGRGFTTGRFFDEAGMLVASVAQQIFVRETGERR